MSDGIWIGVALLGGFGAIARFLLDGLASQSFGRSLPFGTFVINITGSFLLGLLTGLGAFRRRACCLRAPPRSAPTRPSRRGCLRLIAWARTAQVGPGVGNVVISVVLGVGAAAARPGDRSARVNEDCLKLTTYFGERDRTADAPARRRAA